MSRPVTQPKVKGGKRGVIGAVGIILAAVFSLEGGFVDHPSDPGGATNHGITEHVAREHGFSGDMRDLKRECTIEGEVCAESILAKDYIEKPGFLPLIAIDPVVAEEVIDTAVNMGPRRPSRFFQRAVNATCGTQLVVDGKVGRITVGAWKECRAALGPRACVQVLRHLDHQQTLEYERLIRRNPRLRVFRRGWLNHRIGNVDRGRCGERANL
ncbi:MAG: glycosyl hydrolase 108 family protein [Pseudomonadota bacterium]